MNGLGKVGSLINGLYNELNVRMEVLGVVSDMVHAVDLLAIEDTYLVSQRDLAVAHRDCSWLLRKLKSTVKEKQDLELQISSMKFKAEEVREKVVIDIGYIIREGKKVNKMYEKIQSLDGKLLEAMAELEDLRTAASQQRQKQQASTQQQPAEATQVMTTAPTAADGDPKQPNGVVEPASTVVGGSAEPTVGNVSITETAVSIATIRTPKLAAAESNFCSVFHDAEDERLLYIFAFLETSDVLSACQSCKYVYARVYALFCIDSQVVKSDWLVKKRPEEVRTSDITKSEAIQPQQTTNPASMTIPVTPSPVAAAAAAIVGPPTAPSSSSSSASVTSNNPTLLTRDMADALSKKLTAPELKIIINMTERLKKQASQIEAVTAEKEDVVAKLQNAETVRDFLVEKLRSAELALKSALTDNNHLKKQVMADNEVISYLDVRGQELEGINADLATESEHLRQTVDLQLKSHTALEERLTAELQHYKAKADEMESSFKYRKKLLVNEVKSLRSQVESLSIERNTYQSQLQTLRDALNTTHIVTASQSPMATATNHRAKRSQL